MRGSDISYSCKYFTNYSEISDNSKACRKTQSITFRAKHCIASIVKWKSIQNYPWYLPEQSIWVVQPYFPGAVLANGNIHLQKPFLVLLESSAEFALFNFCSTSNHLTWFQQGVPTFILNREKLGLESSQLSNNSEQRLPKQRFKMAGSDRDFRRLVRTHPHFSRHVFSLGNFSRVLYGVPFRLTTLFETTWFYVYFVWEDWDFMVCTGLENVRSTSVLSKNHKWF